MFASIPGKGIAPAPSQAAQSGADTRRRLGSTARRRAGRREPGWCRAPMRAQSAATTEPIPSKRKPAWEPVA